jgi:hypothetical protein
LLSRSVLASDFDLIFEKNLFYRFNGIPRVVKLYHYDRYL